VVTAQDLGLTDDGPDAPLAGGRVSHVGQPVAAVLAETPEAAADAAEAVVVEYEALPAVTRVAAALGEGAPRVLPESGAASEEAAAHGAGGGQEAENAPARPPNMTNRIELERGDVDAALAAADVVARGTYRMARVHHAYMEPHVVTASWQPD